MARLEAEAVQGDQAPWDHQTTEILGHLQVAEADLGAVVVVETPPLEAQRQALEVPEVIRDQRTVAGLVEVVDRMDTALALVVAAVGVEAPALRQNQEHRKQAAEALLLQAVVDQERLVQA